MRRNHEKRNPRAGLFQMMMSLFSLKGIDSETSSKRAYHQVFMEGGNPEFHPVKHTVMNYATQNRLAKKRRRAKS